MMKSLNTYLNLCTQVYELSKPKPPEDSYKFYKSYLTQANGSVLEPMCGTGRFLLPLLAEGFNLDGFDASEHMLNILREKAKALKLKPNVWNNYAEHINLKNKYNLIFIPSGSFGLIIDEKAANTTLKNFYKILNKKATLVFEAETLKATPKQIGITHSHAYKCKDNKMIISTFFDLPLEKNVKTSICRYELVQNNKIIKTEIEEFKVRLYDSQTLINQLKAIGFSKVTLCKAFNSKLSPKSKDEVVVYECKK